PYESEAAVSTDDPFDIHAFTRRELMGTAGRYAAGASLLGLVGFRSVQTAGAAVLRERGAAERGTLTVGIRDSSTSETLDPARSTVTTEFVLSALLYDTLVYIDADGWRLEPRLAEAWEPNRSATRWQFKIRKGVTFHDGRPLTARDVAWS